MAKTPTGTTETTDSADAAPDEASLNPQDDDDRLRKTLLSRIAVAGVVIVGLLGGLAVYDALNRPQQAQLPKMASEGIRGFDPQPPAPLPQQSEVPAGPMMQDPVAMGDGGAMPADAAAAPATAATTEESADDAVRSIERGIQQAMDKAHTGTMPGTDEGNAAAANQQPGTAASQQLTLPATAQQAAMKPAPAMSEMPAAGSPSMPQQPELAARAAPPQSSAKPTNDSSAAKTAPQPAVAARPATAPAREKAVAKTAVSEATRAPGITEMAPQVAATEKNNKAMADEAVKLAKVSPTTETQERAAVTLPKAGATQTSRSYLIQIGVFSDHANALEMVGKLTQAGIPVRTETRVQVGPFASRAEADAARAKLKALGIEESLLVRR